MGWCLIHRPLFENINGQSSFNIKGSLLKTQIPGKILENFLFDIENLYSIDYQLFTIGVTAGRTEGRQIQGVVPEGVKIYQELI